jgi:hypothetical protein
LQKNGFTLKRIVQQPGEFVIIRTGIYHSGFSTGFNISESVNFFLHPWLKKINSINHCQCSNKNDLTDLEVLLKNI